MRARTIAVQHFIYFRNTCCAVAVECRRRCRQDYGVHQVDGRTRGEKPEKNRHSARETEEWPSPSGDCL